MSLVTRLFTVFQPRHYNLRVSMDKSARSFEAQVQISGTLAEPGQSITFHAKDLKISRALVNSQTAKVSLSPETEEVTFSVKEPLAAGDVNLEITAVGKITDPMHGLYPCYFEHDGVKKEILATQFESHFARMVFPCIDEPEAKATFDLTVVSEKNVTVLANTPLKSQEEQGDQLVSTFETTPRMSTYLLAWVAGELHGKSAVTKDGVQVNMWAAPSQKVDNLDFGMEVAVRGIEFYDDYYGVPYPLAKCDMVALPDFSAGAMENWGLITFREECLLVDPKNTAIATKQYVAQVVVHELAHQWFGNLVTMRWWDDLWLNESFARLMEPLVVDKLYPDWHMWTEFSAGDTIAALRRDRLKGVQAVRTGVDHPDEISTLFDPAIVYAKGGKLLQMLHAYLGDETWRKGLRAYFEKHKYHNTEASDLWEALSTASGNDISGFMMPWLSRPGYPFITIEQQSETEFSLTQKRFMSNPTDRKQDRTEPWLVPLMANTSAEPVLLGEATGTLSLQSPGRVPLKLNANDQAFFITYYKSPDHQAALHHSIASGEFGELDRLQLLSEASLLSAAGVMSQVEALELLEAYRHETGQAVWDVMSLVLGETRKLLEDDETATDNLHRYIRELIAEQHERLSWDEKPSESSFDTQLRGLILSWGVFAEDQKIIEEALRRFNAFEKPEELSANLRDVIYTAAIKHGGQPAFDKLLKLYEETQFAEERGNMAGAFATARDASQIAFLLGKFKDPEFVRLQDFARWFAYMIRNKYSREATWQWMVSEWDGWIREKFSSDKSYDMVPRYAAGAMGTPQELEQYKTFFAPFANEPSLKRAVEVGIEDIQARVLWRERDQAAIKAYLAKQ